MEPDVEFFGIVVPPGKTVHLAPSADDDSDADDDGVALVHATQCALGPDPSPGRHTVFAVANGRRVPVGTLQAGVCEQFTLDLMWSALAAASRDASVAFAHTGPSPVYVSGYKTVTSLLDEGSDGGEPESEEEESGESESEEEEEEGAGAGRVKANGRAAHDFSDMSSDEDDVEEDDSEDAPFGATDDDSDDVSDEEEAAAAAALGGAAAAARGGPRTPASAKAGRRAPADDDDDSEDDLSSGSESDDEEEEEEEEEPPPRGAKRAAPAAAAPPPAKKAAAAAAAAPAPTPDVAAFEAAVAAHIRKEGPTKLAALGAAVKKPASLPKLSKWLADHPRFAVDGEQRVSLRK